MNAQLLEETLSANLRKLELLQLERRLDSILEEEDFSGKIFPEGISARQGTAE